MTRSSDETAGSPIQHAALIVAAYVGKNHVPKSELADLIRATLEALQTDTGNRRTDEAKLLQPAVAIRKSVRRDFIVCLEDGKKFKSLKRHLMTRYNMTPENYRQKWGLPSDYPMVAPSYAAARSAVAKGMGLGLRRKIIATTVAKSAESGATLGLESLEPEEATSNPVIRPKNDASTRTTRKQSKRRTARKAEVTA